MKDRIKLLMLVNYIPHYRLPVIEKIGEIYDLTVAHYAEAPLKENTLFKQIKLTPKNLYKFKFYKEDIFKLSSNYDVVLTLSELWTVPNMLLGFKKRSFGLVYWGIGVTASYDKSFDSGGFIDKIRMYISNKADSLLFYSDYPIKKHLDFGIKREKLFVANNTVLVEKKIEIKKEKKHFIFVGSLYKQKKIYDLLHAYKEYITFAENIHPLIIIGDGDEKSNIQKWIQDEKFEEYISLKGHISDQNILEKYYEDSLACISPGQAGLTVLNCMAHGVPFVTTENAITGGEILNIDHNINGIKYKGAEGELSQILSKLSKDNALVNFLSVNAQNHYFENRTVDKMVKGFKEAIDYAYLTINQN
ncbi:glycosyltransferase [Chryseobacterium chendengshani]|uniref:glycosyltransferase n=1 Tax=Chryseobacterium sp. LJ756 TaxID=2864113 RepID=UPI001C64030E|nr:glycosyltransferase [Chryseobacterium sp. LJ756]MBW7676618.1 glycosyltransferase [Chryseobacterium sp. LJ756]